MLRDMRLGSVKNQGASVELQAQEDRSGGDGEAGRHDGEDPERGGEM